jgi:serine/threonine-protein kinase
MSRHAAITLPQRALQSRRRTHVSHYRLDGIIAAGGFGTVFRATDLLTAQRVALKILHPYLVTSQSATLRFMREAETVRRLSHPHVVAIHDVGVLEDGRPYLAMELLDGRDLELHIQSQGQFSLERALDVLAPLASALTAVHALGIVHRDIKASNVVLDERRGLPSVKLLDFGVAKLVDHPGTASLTSQERVGTPSCMAPEQIEGRPVDERTDVYGLGTLAYHLFTGQPPFLGATESTTCYLHVHAPRPRPSRHAALSPVVDEVVMRAMHKDPAQRYASAAAFLEALRHAAQPHAPPEVVGQEIRPALAVYVRVIPSPPPHDSGPDLEEVLDDLLSRVHARLLAAGFQCLMDTSRAGLYIRPFARDPTGDQAQDPAALATQIEAELQRENRLDARATMLLLSRVGEVTVSGDEILDGELTAPESWSARL